MEKDEQEQLEIEEHMKDGKSDSGNGRNCGLESPIFGDTIRCLREEKDGDRIAAEYRQLREAMGTREVESRQ